MSAPVAMRRVGRHGESGRFTLPPPGEQQRVINITHSGLIAMNQVIGIENSPAILSTPVSAHSATVLPTCSYALRNTATATPRPRSSNSVSRAMFSREARQACSVRGCGVCAGR